ncbi:DUF2339 domain-containing protein [Luteimonas sp. Y-2-2-4F]|nr:DUF2339 domain-containing protein [Luteimonas sp. Y-2-2-4F]MCD9033753.1 DUF2339 domain-containing protein [Luteimonas sp. Y-2-2-4F]
MTELLVLAGLALLAMPVLLVVALVMLFGLRGRVTELEAALARLRAEAAGRPANPAPRAAAEAPSPARAAPPPSTPVRTAAPDAPLSPRAPETVATPPAGTAARSHAVRDPAAPDPVARALRLVRRWFTSGNVPVKIGMLVLLAGVAALLKYASDQGWLAVPPELRLAGVAAAALAGLVFGWRRRESHRTFALSVQGGMIGILLLVAFSAYRQLGVLPAGLAFAISVALVAGAGALAVLQNARALAMLAVLAGFLAPIWLSTGGGSHVALFSYYAVLNGAIFGIAWFRAWRELNLLGFVFTFGIGTLWGVLRYAPDQFASAQPFLALFFAFYLAIPLLHARRRPAPRRDIVDGGLVFGAPLVAFSLQAGLLQGRTMALALCALGLAALYAALAWGLLRRARYVPLAQAYALLAVGFATLAVPLALSAEATACVFALEGAALVWLGLRQDRRLPRFAGLALQLAAVVAYALAAPRVPGAAAAFANSGFVGALLIAFAGLAIAACYRQAQRLDAARAAYVWALAWWLGAWGFELMRLLGRAAEPDALLALAAVTGWLAAEAHRRRPDPALGLTLFAAMLAAVPLALWQSAVHAQPFGGYGAWAWALFAVLGARGLACLRGGDGRIARAAQFLWWLLWPLVLSLLLGHAAARAGLADGWRLAAPALPWIAAAALALLRWRWLARPLGAGFDPARPALRGTLCVALSLWWLLALRDAGDSAPLPWLPLLNPLELAQVAVAVLVARWLWTEDAPDGLARARTPLLAALAFLLLTAATLRAAHHWGGVPWNARLQSSGLAQAALTVVWSVSGVLGWVLGSRRGQRTLWLAGAVLMAVVLAKLVLVDRGHLGNLWGIASFIAYGLLCTVVGFLAPAPPREAAPSEQPA